MKSEVVKSVVVKFDKDERDLIRKVVNLINDLMNISSENNCDGYYEVNNIPRDTRELETLIEYLEDLIYSDVVELT